MKLVNNGLDSLEKGVKGIKKIRGQLNTDEQYEYDLKEIIISVHHSIEVLFKYLIQKKSEFLIYRDLDNYFKEEANKIINKDCRVTKKNTIQFLDAVNTVIVLYNLDIDKSIYNKLKILNENRNDLTHYTFEFNHGEVENYLALLLGELIKIYKKHIEIFDDFAKKNKIYEDLEYMNEEIHEKGLLDTFKIMENYDRFEEKMTRVSGEKIKETFKSKKEGAIYTCCPYCKKKLLYVTGNVIMSSGDIFYTGHCEFCKLEVSVSDAKEFYLKFQNYDDVEKAGIEMTIIFHLISSLFLEEELIWEKMNLVIKKKIDKIRGIVLKNRDKIIDEAKSKYKKIMYEVCYNLSKKYFEKVIYPNEKLVEEISIYANRTITLKFNKLLEFLDGDESAEKLKKVSTRFKFIDEESYKLLLEELVGNYCSYEIGGYIDVYGEFRYVEIPLDVVISQDDLIYIKKLIEN